MNDELPAKIGSYNVLSVLGRGGMGNVYKAFDENLSRTVAIKVLPAEFSRRPEFSQRFKTEGKAVADLNHPNIVQVYHTGEEENQQFIVMQCIEGRNLGALISEKKQLPLEQVVEFSRQICRALRYAHKENVIHRDIKPQNILISGDNRVFVTDFGIAKMYATDSTKITNTGMVVGTPEYMSPEQAEGLELNGQTDLYSLGIVMYEMITGYPPFTADSPLGVAYKHVNVDPVAPGAKVPNLNPCLESIVMKCLKKNRIYRYRVVDEILDDLDRVFTTHSDDTKRILSVAASSPLPTLDQRALERRGSDRRHGDRRKTERRDPPASGWRLYFSDNLWIFAVMVLLTIAFLLGFFLNRK